jgi:hypothetical protein
MSTFNGNDYEGKVFYLEIGDKAAKKKSSIKR